MQPRSLKQITGDRSRALRCRVLEGRHEDQGFAEQLPDSDHQPSTQGQRRCRRFSGLK